MDWLDLLAVQGTLKTLLQHHSSKASILQCSALICIAAAAAKSLQSCLTLCNPIDGSPPSLPRPRDSPSKNTGVGCHFLLQCRKVKSENEVAQSCQTPIDPMDCSPPGSCVHGIFQAGVLEWGAIAFSKLSYILATLFLYYIYVYQLIYSEFS